MRKAVLSDRVYMSLKPGMLKILQKELLYRIEIYSRVGGNFEEICDVRQLGNVVSIPIGRQDLIPAEYIIIDKRVIPSAAFNSFLPTLRKSQQLIVDETEDSCLINALVGFGKTITALGLVYKFQTKTIVIVHTKFLLDQWVKEIKTHLNIDAGVIGAGVMNTESSIVVATIQTLTRRWKSLNNISTMFGLVIVDEVHKTPATTYTSTLNKLKSRYKIGLSGTLKRKDGKGVLIPDYFSTYIHQPKQENVMIPSVDIIYTEETFIPVKGSFAAGLTDLSTNINYIMLLASLCSIYSNKGHKVLLVSDRIFMLEALYDLVPNAVIVTGGTKNREEEINKITDTSPYSVILGSTSIFKEGISINPLSCLILGSPTNNIPMLEQLIGRIMRKYEGKLSPIVVDLVLRGGMVLNQANNRHKYYQKQDYDIEYYNNYDKV